MNCKETQDAFTDYLDDSLDGAAAGRLDNHLGRCPECRQALDQLRQALSLLHTMEQVEPPAGLLAGIHARLEPPPSAVARLKSWWEDAMHMSWQTASATVAVTFAAMVVFKTFSPMAPEQPDAGLSTASRAPRPVIELDTRSVANHYERTGRGLAFSYPERTAGRYHQGGQDFGATLYERSLAAPDLTINAGPMTPARQADLHRQLKANCNCATRLSGDEMLVYLPASDLGRLQRVLAQQRIITPGQNLSPAVGAAGKQVLLVNLRLR